VKIKSDPLRRLVGRTTITTTGTRPPLVGVAKRPAVLARIALVVRDEGDEGVDGGGPERQLQEGTPHDEQQPAP